MSIAFFTTVLFAIIERTTRSRSRRRNAGDPASLPAVLDRRGYVRELVGGVIFLVIIASLLIVLQPVAAVEGPDGTPAVPITKEMWESGAFTVALFYAVVSISLHVVAYYTGWSVSNAVATIVLDVLFDVLRWTGSCARPGNVAPARNAQPHRHSGQRTRTATALLESAPPARRAWGSRPGGVGLGHEPTGRRDQVSGIPTAGKQELWRGEIRDGFAALLSVDGILEHLLEHGDSGLVKEHPVEICGLIVRSPHDRVEVPGGTRSPQPRGCPYSRNPPSVVSTCPTSQRPSSLASQAISRAGSPGRP